MDKHVVEPSVTPTPNVVPTLAPHLDRYDITPGVPGFLVAFILAVAVILLGLSLTRRIRALKHASQAEHTTEADFMVELPKALTKREQVELAEQAKKMAADSNADSTSLGETTEQPPS